MKDQILELLKNENMNATELANDLGVQRSSISHILSGRNNPSYEMIFKIIEKYPHINAEWLITGKGSMYKNNEIKETKEELSENKKEKKIKENEGNNKEYKEISDINSKTDEIKVTNVNNIEKVIIFMKNNTFRIYIPE